MSKLAGRGDLRPQENEGAGLVCSRQHHKTPPTTKDVQHVILISFALKFQEELDIPCS